MTTKPTTSTTSDAMVDSSQIKSREYRATTSCTFVTKEALHQACTFDTLHENITAILYIDENFTLRDNNETEETIGIAFSPDAKHLYVAFQEIGVLYDVTRDDLKSFKDATLGYGVSGASLLTTDLILACCCSALPCLVHSSFVEGT